RLNPAAPALTKTPLTAPPQLRVLRPAPQLLAAQIRTPLLRVPPLLRPAAPEVTRTQLLPAAPLLLTRVLPLLTRTPPQLTMPQRLTRMRMQTQARNCPRPLLRCRYSACWDLVLWLPASLVAKRNNHCSST